jgi:hypothetical protein
MSIDIFLVCTKCKTGIHVGQSSAGTHKPYVYSSQKETMDKLANFLEEHSIYEDGFRKIKKDFDGINECTLVVEPDYGFYGQYKEV